MITRSIDHQYSYEGKVYPGVTGILKILDKSGPLMGWAARQTAEAAVRLIPELPKMLETVGEEGVIKTLTARKTWTNEKARDLGSNVHDLIDRISRGESPKMSPAEAHRVQLYREWLADSGWTVKVSEAYVLNELGYGGTIDILARDADGRAVLADIKTGKVADARTGDLYNEIILQLAAYGMASLIQPVGGKVFSMPAIDRYAVIHLTEDGCRPIEVAIEDADRTAFYAALALSEWTKRAHARGAF